jgi:hypothetical protein
MKGEIRSCILGQIPATLVASPTTAWLLVKVLKLAVCVGVGTSLAGDQFCLIFQLVLLLQSQTCPQATGLGKARAKVMRAGCKRGGMGAGWVG